QLRNNWIETVDEAIAAQLELAGVRAPHAEWNTETPGSAIDRLSILALRLYHMQEQLDRKDATAEHRLSVGAKLVVLHQQHNDLSTSLTRLLEDLFAGRKQLK